MNARHEENESSKYSGMEPGWLNWDSTPQTSVTCSSTNWFAKIFDLFGISWKRVFLLSIGFLTWNQYLIYNSIRIKQILLLILWNNSWLNWFPSVFLKIETTVSQTLVLTSSKWFNEVLKSCPQSWTPSIQSLTDYRRTMCIHLSPPSVDWL